MRAYKRALTSLALVAQAAVFIPAISAQDEIPKLEPGKMLSVEGRRGRWWPLETAAILAEEHLALTEMRKLLAQYDAELAVLREQLVVKDQRIEQLKLAGGLSEARALIAESSIQHAEKGRQAADKRAAEAEAQLHVWWRHPALWAALGLAVGASAVAVIQSK